MIETKSSADSRYLDGAYAASHPDWHDSDAPWKVADLKPAFQAVVAATGATGRLNVADIGAGTGSVITQLSAWAREQWPTLDFVPSAFEVSPDAAGRARELYPLLDVRQKLFEESDGPFDVAMMVDVLEHLDNPWELLRKARRASRYLVVRQPLLGNFSRFRHDNYRDQRDHWGHVALFNVRSFVDMAASCGWNVHSVALLAPWELAHQRMRPGLAKRALVRANRTMASFFLDGFYLNGTFH